MPLKYREQRENRRMRLLTRRITRMETEVHQAMAVVHVESGKLLKYKQLIRHSKCKGKRQMSSANKFWRLANRVGDRIKWTNTIKFIKVRDVPKNRMKDVTYGQLFCIVCPEKSKQNRICSTVAGDKVKYPGDVVTPTAEMLVAKLLFTSVVSTPGAQFMTMDISNFYLMTQLQWP